MKKGRPTFVYVFSAENGIFYFLAFYFSAEKGLCTFKIKVLTQNAINLLFCA